MRATPMVIAALAFAAPPALGGGAVALAVLPAPKTAPPSLGPGVVDDAGALEAPYSAFGRDLSPPINWRPLRRARSWALIVEDPDAPGPKPFVHWLIWNIPGETTRLTEGLPAAPVLAAVGAARQGRNGFGAVGWRGPHPPKGPAHHYHFQLFALDGPVSAAPGADRDSLIAAMRGHVVGESQTVATFRAP